jgi:hypothetical protein
MKYQGAKARRRHPLRRGFSLLPFAQARSVRLYFLVLTYPSGCWLNQAHQDFGVQVVRRHETTDASCGMISSRQVAYEGNFNRVP